MVENLEPDPKFLAIFQNQRFRNKDPNQKPKCKANEEQRNQEYKRFINYLQQSERVDGKGFANKDIEIE